MCSPYLKNSPPACIPEFCLLVPVNMFRNSNNYSMMKKLLTLCCNPFFTFMIVWIVPMALVQGQGNPTIREVRKGLSSEKTLPGISALIKGADTGVFSDADRKDNRDLTSGLVDHLKQGGAENGLQSIIASLAFDISGQITDEYGDGLPGATVLEKGTTNGTVADVNGNFSLTVSSETAVLVISFVGYEEEEILINGRSQIAVSLTPDIASLKEIVIVGYGTQKKETLTGAISTIETKELVQSPVANISNSLVGRLPGLMAIQSGGEPGFDQSSIRIRGVASLNAGGESDPLVLVDGGST